MLSYFIGRLGLITLRSIPNSYYNRKSYHSIKIQAVVDAEAKFVDVFVGWPGRSHDARCFNNSPLRERIENGFLPTYGLVILGDSAYPVRPYLITPFKAANPGTNKTRFNTALSKARQVSEADVQCHASVFIVSHKTTRITIEGLGHLLGLTPYIRP